MLDRETQMSSSPEAFTELTEPMFTRATQSGVEFGTSRPCRNSGPMPCLMSSVDGCMPLRPNTTWPTLYEVSVKRANPNDIAVTLRHREGMRFEGLCEPTSAAP